MEITSTMIQELRSKTGLGIMKCKEALIETKGDIEAAIEYLRKKGLAEAAKKSSRSTSEGLLGYYIHHSGKLGVMVEVFCETDFVAKTADFQELIKNVAMHIASAAPFYLDKDHVPTEVLEKERAIYREQVAEMKKPEKIIEKIVEGKLDKFYSQFCLLDQPYVKQDDITIRDYLNGFIAKLGENIQIGRFVRMNLGEN
jgi:elongation factor Ts